MRFASLKSLVENRERRAVAVERSLKPFFLAALTCTGTLLFALLHVAYQSLHLARIPPGLSATLLERQLTRTLRSFLKGGRRAYPAARELPRQLRALSAGQSGAGSLLPGELPPGLAADVLAPRRPPDAEKPSRLIK